MCYNPIRFIQRGEKCASEPVFSDFISFFSSSNVMVFSPSLKLKVRTILVNPVHSFRMFSMFSMLPPPRSSTARNSPFSTRRTKASTTSGVSWVPISPLYADFSEGLDLQMVISDILLLEITYAAFSPIGNLLPAVLSRTFAFLRIIYVGPEKNRHCSTVFTEMRFVIKLLPAFGAHIEPGKVTDPAFSFSPAVFHGA